MPVNGSGLMDANYILNLGRIDNHLGLSMIYGKSIRLRAVEKTDLRRLRDWRNREEVRRWTREYKLLNMANQKKWFASLCKDPPEHLMFIIETQIDGKWAPIGVCGLCYIDLKNRNAEISEYISPDSPTKPREDVIRTLVRYGFQEIGLHRISREVYTSHDEVIKVMENLGFHREGMLRHVCWREGEWRDSYIYSVLEGESLR